MSYDSIQGDSDKILSVLFIGNRRDKVQEVILRNGENCSNLPKYSESDVTINFTLSSCILECTRIPNHDIHAALTGHTLYILHVIFALASLPKKMH